MWVCLVLPFLYFYDLRITTCTPARPFFERFLFPTKWTSKGLFLIVLGFHLQSYATLSCAALLLTPHFGNLTMGSEAKPLRVLIIGSGEWYDVNRCLVVSNEYRVRRSAVWSSSQTGEILQARRFLITKSFRLEFRALCSSRIRICNNVQEIGILAFIGHNLDSMSASLKTCGVLFRLCKQIQATNPLLQVLCQFTMEKLANS